MIPFQNIVHPLLCCLPVAVLVTASPLLAQDIFSCKGVWTTVPCGDFEGTQSQYSLSIIETPKIAPVEEKKHRLLEDFERLRYKLAQKHGFYFRPGLEESTCLNPESTAEECNAAINESEARLMAQVKLEQQPPKEVKVSQQNGDNIAISVSDNRSYRYPYYRYLRDKPRAPIYSGDNYGERKAANRVLSRIPEGKPNLNRRTK